ncbi:MAG: hypothetical protein U0W24_07865 [Bacteroidales bacterium]
MRKIAFLLVMALLSATFVFAHGGDYVKTSKGVYFMKKVRFGVNCCLVGITDKGEHMNFQKADIISFSKNGAMYEKMPVYKNNQLTGEEEFMKLVSVRNGMKLYEYEYISKKSGEQSRRYYVFKGDKLIVEMNNTNRQTLTDFFNRE